jgi:Tfp pilus assembly PilM family ATPase
MAVEITARRVTVVGLVPAGGRPRVAAQASEPLAEGVIAPGLSAPNVLQPQVAAEALRQAIARAGLESARRTALVLSDSVARVSLLGFEAIPARAAELDELVRWQLRKATPFPLEDAQVTHFPAAVQGTTTMLAAVVARREVIAEYEAVAAAAGLHAGLVDLASFNVMNAAIAAGIAPAADWLFVHHAPDRTTLAILRGASLLFYRHRTAVDDEPLGALVHQTAMYHEDRLGGGAFARVLVSGEGGGGDAVRAEIGARLGVEVAAIDVRGAAALDERLGASAEMLDALAAPIGILIRDRAA